MLAALSHLGKREWEGEGDGGKQGSAGGHEDMLQVLSQIDSYTDSSQFQSCSL